MNSGASPDPETPEVLFLAVYEELRRVATLQMSDQRRQVTFQATALVHEAYLRISAGSRRTFESRAHFLRTASKAMRRVLVDAARSRAAAKRGAGATLMTLPEEHAADAPAFDVLAVDEALGRLERIDPRGSRVVELRFFCGLGMDEVAATLGITPRTAFRDWESARAWLFRELSP